MSHQSYHIPESHPVVKKIEATLSPLIHQYFYKPLSEMSISRVFMKHYHDDSNNQLKIHVDNSYITVSLCIMGDCEGSEVQFKNNAVKLNNSKSGGGGGGVTGLHEDEPFFTLKPMTGWI